MLRKGIERNAQPFATQLRASFSSSTTAGAGNLALVGDAQQQSGGFLSRLFGTPQRITTPLTEPLPGLDYPPPATQATSPPDTQVTTLPNGLKVASEATPVSLTVRSPVVFVLWQPGQKQFKAFG